MKNTLLFHKVTDALIGSDNLTMNVGKSASVKLFENECRELTEPLHGFVVAERKTDVGDLPATINPLRVGNKQDAGYRQSLGSNVEKRTIGLLPHGMKLCFYENLWPFPYRPANNALTTSGRNLTINDWEAIINWCARKWATRNKNWRCVRNNTAAEPQHVGLDELGRTHEDIEQSNV